MHQLYKTSPQIASNISETKPVVDSVDQGMLVCGSSSFSFSKKPDSKATPLPSSSSFYPSDYLINSAGRSSASSSSVQAAPAPQPNCPPQ